MWLSSLTVSGLSDRQIATVRSGVRHVHMRDESLGALRLCNESASLRESLLHVFMCGLFLDAGRLIVSQIIRRNMHLGRLRSPTSTRIVNELRLGEVQAIRLFVHT